MGQIVAVRAATIGATFMMTPTIAATTLVSRALPAALLSSVVYASNSSYVMARGRADSQCISPEQQGPIARANGGVFRGLARLRFNIDALVSMLARIGKQVRLAVQ